MKGERSAKEEEEDGWGEEDGGWEEGWGEIGEGEEG